jgi:translocation and assembly module TamB
MTESATTPDPQAPLPAKRRSRWWIALSIFGVVIVLALAVVATWLSSESALVTLLDWAVAQSEGKLAIDRPRGTLLGRIELGRIVYRDESTTVTIEDVLLDHAPRTLLDRRLTIQALSAKRVRIDARRKDDEPLSMPDSLEIPVDVRIDSATIEHLEWHFGTDQEGALDSIRFSYTGDRRMHRVQDVDIRGKGGRLAGSASVGTTRPFPTRASLTLDLVKPNPEGRVEAQLDGDLSVLSLVAKSTLAGVAADAQAKVAPFANQPFLEGRLDAKEVDLARLDADWPVTRLNIVVNAEPSPGGFSGSAQVANAMAGPIDANRIPITQLRGSFTLSGVMLELRDLAAQAGGGTVSGSGTVNIDTFENRWKLVVAALDLKRLHGSLIPTSLAGRIEADVNDRIQRVVADVSQKDLQLSLAARYDGKTLFADRLIAQAYGGSVEGSGRIALAGNRPFAADLRARRFNPARFGDFPAGSIDGTIVATGTASPAIVVEADAAIAPGSRLAGLATQGRIRGRFAPASVQALIADVTMGTNRVQARGALGRAGDRLELMIAAKRLSELDPLLPAEVPKPVSGAIDATATVETLARGARVDVDARATQLGASADWQFATLAIAGRATHAAPVSQLRIDALQDVSLAVDAMRASTPAGRADRARVSLAGSANAHTLSFAASDGESGIDGGVSASLAGSGPALVWRGRVENLSVRGVPGLTRVALASPAPFVIARERVVFDAFRIEGDGATLDVDTFAWVRDAIDTRGRFRSLPFAPLLKRAGLADRFPTDITVGGTWDVSSSPSWRGTLKVARERGDLYIDDPTLESASKISLGIETLAVNATLDGTRLTGNAELRARLGGNALADFDVRAIPGSSHPFSAAAPIRATIRAHLPSLASLQPWIGTSARVQGQAIADVAVAGTLGKPELSGQVVGYGLRVDMPRYGVNYKDGQLRIASGPEGLKLEELSFAAGDGRFVASGLIGLPGASGAQVAASRIQWHAENFRALNRPDLRIVVDGEGTLALEQKRLVLRGKLSADEGNIEYRSTADTTLANDIIVVGRPRPASARPDAMVSEAPLDLDLELMLGSNLRFAGEGLDARLAGRVQVTSKAGAPIIGKGVIRTVRGTYYAFGQKLDIDRGRILFDGPLGNPSLDIVALRKNLPVEAGVEIVGTVRAPLVRLTSNPPVPDNEKLAWLLTGGPSGSESARESAALAAAAAALMGGEGKPLTQQLAQKIGLDDISVAQRDTAEADPLSGQVVTLGKRITDRLYVAYEQGVSLATNALRVEYVLSRFLTVSAFAGTSSGIALNFRRNWP